MNKNINFLYKKLIERYKNLNCNLFLKNFINLYEDKIFIQDKFLFDNIDFSLLNILDFKNLNLNLSDYTILNQNFLKNKQKIVILNGLYLYSENLSNNIYIEEQNFSSFIEFELNNFESILQNYNLVYIINKIFSKKQIHININNSKNQNEKLYILNFYTKEFKNYLFTSNFFINLSCNSKIEIVDFKFLPDNFNLISNNFFFNLEKFSNLNYNTFNKSNIKVPSISSFYIKNSLNSKFNFNSFFSGVFFSKLFYNSFLDGKNSIFNKKNFIELKDDSIFYIDTKIFHNFSKTLSDSAFKVTVDNNSKFYSKGIINVNIDISLIEASLKYNGLLLSNNSEIVFIPELDINSYNLKCNHSATIGYLNEVILFYMMSRGLSKLESTNLFIKSFLLFDFKKSYFITFLNSNKF